MKNELNGYLDTDFIKIVAVYFAFFFFFLSSRFLASELLNNDLSRNIKNENLS